MAQPATSDQPSTEQAHLNAWLKRNLCSVETGIQQDNAQVTCNISVKDYLAINNLRPEDDENWLDDTAIDFALAVLTNKHNRQSGNDVGVLPMYQGTELYNWGKGAKEAEAEHQQRRPLVESTPKEKRYIVVPVSDGVLDSETIIIAMQKLNENVTKTAEEARKAKAEAAQAKKNIKKLRKKLKRPEKNLRRLKTKGLKRLKRKNLKRLRRGLQRIIRELKKLKRLLIKLKRLLIKLKRLLKKPKGVRKLRSKLKAQKRTALFK
ncbi:hypothetical protein PtrV1_03765 [Pyrenophora tritici-repentis]|uniref:TolA, Membrane protein involved in colicin uptake n=1 Tax=Pyrenophora tritici-repentis TaxID=45151 RepID=A0A2W1HH18_9PLEO|nr:hypothetical protein PtrV1_03765 [Pyrenophora tritici-repentis]KAF7575450.1 TolA, Membrane protein involved in colicin uptake [Pyrenophora tritici-repentis]KAI0582180.1 hypothetical protein Alg215_04282 [Pyrenophora tritici-repentis]KAI1590479.1 hypothetical protein PtrEW13061_005425 [Pyrenophora tritici-repentis]PZD44224.1 hypothetical protein A1F97_02277 [Pyrenophora tritici-repentis]